MKKWHMIIDVAKCENCNNCFLACKDEHIGNEWPGYTLEQPLHGHRWINIMRKERGQFPLIDVAYRPTPCMNCDEAPCVKASQGSIVKRPDGIVLIDYQKANGKNDLVKACPYGAIWWNEENQTPQKCTSCAHLLDEGWQQPRCVQACPTGCLKMICVDQKELEKIIKEENLEVLHPEFNTKPSVYYKNLYRYDKCFIGGSVAYEEKGVSECAKGARVSLYKENVKLAEMQTDAFGDFKFDSLEEKSGAYTIVIQFKTYDKIALNVNLEQSINLGVIKI
ncbi:MAG: oxidoreductase [Peptococcaceae bacterium]|nr:oxidoreductase [Peptococcaceae bacterium]